MENDVKENNLFQYTKCDAGNTIMKSKRGLVKIIFSYLSCFNLHPEVTVAARPAPTARVGIAALICF
jgi:hypothetical protein